MARRTKSIHLAGRLQVSKLIERESETDFEKDIRDPLLIGLVVFINRYLFCGGFRPLSTDRAKRITINLFVYNG